MQQQALTFGFAPQVQAPDALRVVHYKMDSFDVYVGRPSSWGNPFHKDDYGGIPSATLADYLLDVYHTPGLIARIKRELRGKILACWCAKKGGIGVWDQPTICHAQLLARIANE